MAKKKFVSVFWITQEKKGLYIVLLEIVSANLFPAKTVVVCMMTGKRGEKKGLFCLLSKNRYTVKDREANANFVTPFILSHCWTAILRSLFKPTLAHFVNVGAKV